MVCGFTTRSTAAGSSNLTKPNPLYQQLNKIKWERERERERVAPVSFQVFRLKWVFHHHTFSHSPKLREIGPHVLCIKVVCIYAASVPRTLSPSVVFQLKPPTKILLWNETSIYSWGKWRFRFSLWLVFFRF